MSRDGATGWDEYADFYDWENARTMARRDVPFWRRLAAESDGPILELGCGTGRITLPVGRAARVPVVGVDLSDRMLARARNRVRRARLAARVHLLRADIRQLPFRSRAFAIAMAPYGVFQSLLADRDLAATLDATARVLRPGARLVLELVADLPRWREYHNQTKLTGWRPGRRAHLTLVESVRQDPRRRLTIFEQEFIERRGGQRRRRRFELTFRTLSVPQMCARLEAAGFEVTARLGSYRGDPWTPASETWLLVARRS